MQSTIKKTLIGVVVLAVCAGAYFILQPSAGKNAAQPQVPVQVIKSAVAEQKSIAVTLRANGYVTAINTVDVRPQVQNIVRVVHVKEGQDVRAGQLLFTLDERSDQSNVAKARAEVAANRADLLEAELALKRNEELRAQNFVSQAVVDTARSRVESLRSTMEANLAATQGSSIALGYNRITASIAGRIGLINVHPGSLAQPTGDPMLTIYQMDPIAVSFSIPERELANIRASYPNGDAPVTAQVAGQEPLQGKLIFIDNAADPQTGTIRMKAQFANADLKLWPSGFVNVSLVSRTLPDAVLIPAQGVVTGPTEKFVYVVQPDDTVKEQKISVVYIDGGFAAVTGLAAGTRVAVEGTQNLRAGGKVREAEAPKAGGAKQ